MKSPLAVQYGTAQANDELRKNQFSLKMWTVLIHFLVTHIVMNYIVVIGIVIDCERYR